MEWQSSWAFFLIPIVLFVAVFRWIKRREATATLRFSSLQALRGVHQGVRAYLSELPRVLKVIALILVIAAIARPQFANTKIKRSVEGIDIMIVLDISDSMLIEDMQPVNRMEASKTIMHDFIRGRNSDRIGLVVFSGEAYTRVPLTLDYDLLLENLKQVAITRNMKMGTAIGVALANATARLKDSTAKSRVIIFMTDGESNSGTIDPETALNIAKGYGFKIYSIGMGKDGQAQLPVYINDPSGRQIKQYRPIHSKINEELLGRFASETGGKFWRANTTNALKEAFDEIDALEKTKIATDKFTRYSEHFQDYLKWALFFYALAILLGQTVLRRVP
jgi:Ca-activated chloride channel family protein